MVIVKNMLSDSGGRAAPPNPPLLGRTGGRAAALHAAVGRTGGRMSGRLHGNSSKQENVYMHKNGVAA